MNLHTQSTFRVLCFYIELIVTQFWESALFALCCLFALSFTARMNVLRTSNMTVADGQPKNETDRRPRAESARAHGLIRRSQARALTATEGGRERTDSRMRLVIRRIYIIISITISTANNYYWLLHSYLHVLHSNDYFIYFIYFIYLLFIILIINYLFLIIYLINYLIIFIYSFIYLFI